MSKVYVYNEKLKHARELRGWSQEELARRVGDIAESMGRRGVVLDVSTISRWERGRNSPSPFYRQLLCTLFEMNAEELGLLPSDNLPRLVEETFSLPTLNTNEPAFSEPGPLAEIYSRDIPAEVEEGAERREIVVAGNASSASAPPRYLLFIRRRDVLFALLASATVGGGAAALVKLFQSRRQPSTPDSPAPTSPPAPTSVAQSTPNARNTPATQNKPPVPTQAPATPLSRYWPVLAPDRVKKVANVRVLQWMLNAHGWKLEVDGIFGPDTESALKAFEKSINIPVTTTLDKLTWERLIVPSGMQGQQITDQGDYIKALQEMLNNRGASPRLDVDGSFGPLTRAATSKFQRANNLPDTGQADLNTWCLLVGGSLR